jgi:cytochrome c
MRPGRLRHGLLGLAIAAIAPAEADADGPVASAPRAPAAFRACAACHAVSPAATPGIGPNLYGVVGRRAGALPGYGYSSALRQSGIVWSRAELERFMQDPAAAVPGTTMPAAAPLAPADREAISAYLAALR